MTTDLFVDFYRAVHGFAPFPWQLRLLNQVVKEGWPPVLALPTAAGKTSAIDIAVVSLALEAGKSLSDRTAPLRIFFVIDRRLVVDQVYEHSRKLQRALTKPEGQPAVAQVAASLMRFGGAAPLHVGALRGAMYRDDTWARLPNQPMVCVTTVDQVGSRLLFRGYGVSEYARPVHAGLTGNDALYLVDEAHLSQPFLQTLKAVARYRKASPIGGPFTVVEMSATPQGNEKPFQLTNEDVDSSEELARRLSASKPADLLEPAKLEEEACRLAVEAMSGEVKVIGIVANRVASARDIFRRLPGEPMKDKVLLTGRIRPWDRDALLRQFLDRVKAGRKRKSEDHPLFVAATMTVEVGADLDFDYLITEAAPLASLRQRFGRLDRLGRFEHAAGAILLRKTKEPDPIYGEDLSKTWEWLTEQTAPLNQPIDFGVNAFKRMMEGAASAPPEPEPQAAPSLFPAHLDSLVQTSPTPNPSPDVAPFLHGPKALEAGDVQIVWRADLALEQEKVWVDIVKAAPPRTQEALPVPLSAVRQWLRNGPRVEVADLEGVPTPETPPGPGRPVLRWRGPDLDDGTQVTNNPYFIQPGDTIVVPALYGGADSFGWDPEADQPVTDVADLCINDMANSAPDDGRARLIRVRLYRGWESQLAPAESADEATFAPGLIKELRRHVEAGDDEGDILAEFLRALRERPPVEPLTAAVVQQMTKSKVHVEVYPAGVILTTRVPPGFFITTRDAEGVAQEVDDTTDTDDSSSLRGGIYRPVPVTLEEHSKGVVGWIRRFIETLGLPENFGRVLIKAAQFHDWGKADPRFQFILYGDEPGTVLLAKSGKDLDIVQQERVRRRAGLPRGYRHELVSVALVRAHAGRLLGDLPKEGHLLVEHLVGTHHGRGRPFVPFIEDNAPQKVEVDSMIASSDHRLHHLASGWTDSFWELVGQLGYWGLAYLETVLRLADSARSAEEQKGEAR